MRVAIVVAAFCLTGCAGGAAQADRAVAAMADFVEASEPILVAAYEREQEACLERMDSVDRVDCVTKVRAEWKPIIDAIEVVRDVWCGIVPDGEGC